MLFPHTETRRITLQPATAADAPRIYEILFRLGRGGLPMLDTFTANFGDGVSACFLLHRKGSSDLVGFCTLYGLTPAGHLQAEVNVAVGQPEVYRADASALITNFAFSMWRTRKVYFHATEPNAAAIGFDGAHAKMVRAEAVLPAHTFFHGQVWDVHVFAIYRDDWNAYGTDLLKQLV